MKTKDARNQKKCQDCKVIKPKSCFDKDMYSIDLLANVCQDCMPRRINLILRITK